MKADDRNHFAAELDEIANKLRKEGRSVAPVGMVEGEGGLRSNFVLPYSSLPRRHEAPWKRSERVS